MRNLPDFNTHNKAGRPVGIRFVVRLPADVPAGLKAVRFRRVWKRGAVKLVEVVELGDLAGKAVA